MSVRAWFQRFKAGNKELEDEPRSGRPTAVLFDELKNLAEQHPYEGMRYFVASLGCSLSTVSNGLRSLGMVKKLGQWLPHALSDGNRQRRLDICTRVLSRSRRSDWLDTIVTGDEKWALYVNHTHKHARCADDEMPVPIVKSEIHEKKVMLQLLPKSTALNCKYWLKRFARSTRSSTMFACCTMRSPSHREEDFRENSGTRMGSFYRTHRAAGTCPERPPPLPIASASPGREVFR